LFVLALYLVCGGVSINAASVYGSNGAGVSCFQHTADFGPPAFTYNVTGPFTLLENICDATHDLTAKLVLTTRGCAKPTSMALRAQELGAVAIVIANNVDEPGWGFIMKNDVVPNPVLIPTVSIGLDCHTMIQQMTNYYNKKSPSVHFRLSISDGREYTPPSTGGFRPPRTASSSSSTATFSNTNTWIVPDDELSHPSIGDFSPTVIWCTVSAALLIVGVITGVCWRRHRNHKRDLSHLEPGTATANTTSLLPYTAVPVCP